MKQIDFGYVVKTCLKNKEFVAEYDRLNGTNLSKKLSPLENAIESATGLREKELLSFIAFVDLAIWSPLIEKQIS